MMNLVGRGDVADRDRGSDLGSDDGVRKCNSRIFEFCIADGIGRWESAQRLRSSLSQIQGLGSLHGLGQPARSAAMSKYQVDKVMREVILRRGSRKRV